MTLENTGPLRRAFLLGLVEIVFAPFFLWSDKNLGSAALPANNAV
jgi:hypothetical protein